MQHKGKSRYRGIEFLLTFEEWWSIWQASGKWELRGRRRGQYVMARYGDQGAYEAGNVRICPVSENVAESNRGMDYSAERRSASMKAWWANASKKQRRAISHALSVNNGSHRPEVRAKQSEAAKRRWARVRGEAG
jgi:hypothetical protein